MQSVKYCFCRSGSVVGVNGVVGIGGGPRRGRIMVLGGPVWTSWRGWRGLSVADGRLGPASAVGVPESIHNCPCSSAGW